MRKTVAVTGYTHVQNHIQQDGSVLRRWCGLVRNFARRKHPWLSGLLVGALLVAMPRQASAQGSSAQTRITTQIDESKMSVVSGNLHPQARPQNDHGKVDPSFKLERITMMFQPTAAQQADLNALLAAQQNPTSPSFHQWLTPAQYADRFGVTQSDLTKVSTWLQAQGFAVVETPPSRTWIVFGGTAAQVESAFHTEIHNYAANGKTFYANSAEPSVPAALAGLVLGFRGLNNYPVKPRAIKKSGVSSVQPNFTDSNRVSHYIAPDDFATIYDLKPLYASSPPIDGTGQKIVIVGQTSIVTSDITTFRSLSGLPVNAPQLVPVPNVTPPGVLDGDVQEASLDIEWSGAVARNATIIYVYSPNVFTSLQYAIGQNLAPVISISYGGCEATFAASNINSFVAMAQQANSQGITIVSSVGDGGATDCDGELNNYPAELGLNVDIPGSLPYVTGVGGTEFDDGNGTYWNTTNNSSNGSAISYIPEKTWNDTAPPPIGLEAGGGGASSIFGKPSWQTGTGVPADGVRDVPDISVNASPNHDGYLICSQVQGTNPLVSGCTNGFRISNTNTNMQVYGGTSFGGPTFAGILALINQKTGSTGQGNVNYILYPLAASSPTAFHDVTTWNNASSCTLGTQDCPDGSPIGFTAGLGYDQATGLGTIDVTNLVNAWSSISTGAGLSPILSSVFPTSISAGSADFTLTATGSNFATNAQILWNGSTAGITMQSGGTSTSIKATISHTLVAYGTIASVTVTDNAAKAGESSASQPFTVNGTPPVNDNIANAIAITSSNFTGTVDNSAATTDTGGITDPTPPCALTAVPPSTNPRTKTVWWSLASTGTALVTVSTIGSTYDTTLSVWIGTPGSLTNVACNDDVSGGQYTQSLLTFSATAGTKYYFMVAPFGPPETGADLLGGKTVLNITNATPAPSPAVITSGSNAAFTVGIEGSFAVMATGSPAPTFTAAGALPTGVTLGAISGVLSGKPAPGTAGTYPITITAHNGSGTDATQNFTLTVNQVAAITSANNTTFAVGTAGTFTLTATGVPTPALSETGALPSGVTFTAATGVLAGTPAAGTGGHYPITLAASNGVGTNAVQSFALTVNQAPAITSANSMTFMVGTAGTFTATATGTPASTFSELGALPSGVTLSTAGVLSGTPAAGTSGSYPIIITAHNGVGADATQNFTLTVNPAVLSGLPASQTAAAGSPATYTITNTGNVSYALTCSGLPTGAACSPVSVGMNSTASLVITTTSRTLAVTPAMPTRPLHLNLWGEALLALAISILTLLALRRRRVQALIPVSVLALLLVLLVAGCGGSGGSSGGGGGVNPNGTPAGTYPITVIGTPSSGTTQNTSIILVVT